MSCWSWKIGEIKITSFVELQAGQVIQEGIPKATKTNVVQIPWLMPYFADCDGNLQAVVQSFVIETPRIRILIDPGIGNDKLRTDIPQWGNLQTDFLKRLEKMGYPPDSIDTVVFTHLHFDHVGWNTRLVSGCWVPTFPKARHLVVKPEFEYWERKPKNELTDDRAGFADSVLPVYEAGLVDLVSVEYVVSDGVSLFPTPGHTPFHVSILLQSQGKQAVVTGDVFHHPCQISHPEWESLADNDKQKTILTRRAFLERFADSKTLILGSHFVASVAGYLSRDKERFKFGRKKVSYTGSGERGGHQPEKIG